MKDKCFIVFWKDDREEFFPMAYSTSQSSAVGYANLCERDTYIKRCSFNDALKYIEKFYMVNLDL